MLIFQRLGVFYQMGRPPVRVDVLTSLSGLNFPDCWERRVAGRFGTRNIWVSAIDDLIVNKRTVGRLQDLADVERLEEARKKRGA